MVPFDGRPNCSAITDFAAEVWMLCALESAHKDPFWLVGQIVRVRTRYEYQPAIRRLCAEYIDTIVGAL
jgi:hypothetical protein